MAFCFRHVKAVKCSLSRTAGLYLKAGTASRGIHIRAISQFQVKSLASQTILGLGKYNRHTLLDQSRILACATYSFRNNSTQSQTQGTSLPEGYIPEPPPIPIPSAVDTVSTDATVVEQLNALGEPTLASLGLCNYTPSGFVQLALESLHVSADIPWWGAIVAGTVVLRILMFPLVILSQKNAANMHNHMPTVQKLQEKFTKARQSGNPLDAARVGHEMTDYMSRNKVNPLKNMLVPLAQLPVFLSVFVGVRAMASLPVESMTTGGLLWFTDLTIADPYYVMPVMTMLTFLLTVELGVDGVKAGTMTPMMKMFLRAMPFIMLPLICNFPAAMLCYWFTSNAFSLVQVLLLKIPSLRTACGIPQMVTHEKSALAKKKSFREGFQDSWENSKLASSIVERERMDAVKFKEAGSGRIQKTFSYDPTKGKKS